MKKRPGYIYDIGFPGSRLWQAKPMIMVLVKF